MCVDLHLVDPSTSIGVNRHRLDDDESGESGSATLLAWRQLASWRKVFGLVKNGEKGLRTRDALKKH